MKKNTPDLLSEKYWTTPEEACEEISDLVPGSADEFPQGASDSPDELSRRGMLGLMGASLAFASLEGCRRPVETIVPFAKAPEHRIPGIPEYFATTMPFGTAAYGMLVESHEGRPTKIEGNELHPASLGAASAWMQASILGLYDPDRLPTVVRVDPGAGASASTWEDFSTSWQERRTAHLATGGGDLAILSDGYSSPSLARLAAELRSSFPRARWVVHEPVSDENLFAGIRLVTGTPSRPVYHLDRASVLVTLDADPLHTETDSVAQTRGFAARRNPDEAMNRLYAIESTLTLTGAAADRRARMRSSEIPGFTAALARELATLGVAVPVPEGVETPVAAEHQALLADIARDLVAAGGSGVVMAGRSQDLAVHAVVHAINSALGAPVTLHPVVDVGFGNRDGLSGLVAAIQAGDIASLVILGGNPAYDTPADFDLAQAIASVDYSVHLTERENETSKHCTWRLPRAHYLESWGDARSVDGTASIVQPLIEPLLGGRGDLEVAALIVRGEAASGYQIVRETWQSLEGPELESEDLGFERRWRRYLHDGVILESALPAVASAIGSNESSAAMGLLLANAPAKGLELTFRPSSATFDGRFANNAWLQEIPDPITKITWNNAVLVSPTTATELGIETGDVVRITLDERALDAPAFVLPGQADGSVTLTLGYGHDASGRVAGGIGYSAYALRSSASLWQASGVSIELTGRSERLVQTQEHWRMEGRHLVREASLGEFRDNPTFAATPEEHLDPVELWPQPRYDKGYQWGMAIDLNRCTGCNACVVACQSENNIPVVGADQVARGREMQWLRVDRYFEGELEDPKVVFQPVTCQHCENAPCEQVCPVAATVHDREGLNVMVYNRCIGTRYCSNNCPYKVRRFNFYNFTKDTPELVKLAMNPDVTVRSRGVMEKCTFCIQRINSAKRTAKREERTVEDRDLRTACQQTCPADAITFGNINDPDSRVSEVKRDQRNYLLLAELGNKPRTSYLAKIRNPGSREERA
ncbi:MAG: 4Fe-4S dicluster domain-containing protein [Acidobacteriota bacterium]|nr:4Fe-4S dicluster domain-containing protein [Acidobacteriota bacterium]